MWQTVPFLKADRNNMDPEAGGRGDHRGVRSKRKRCERIRIWNVGE